MNSQACDHLVQSYTDDAFLVKVVSDYLAAGLGHDEAAVVVATPAHVDALQHRLAGDGIDVPRALATPQLLCLDAARTLAAFMVDGAPERSAFMAIVVAALDRLRSAGYVRVRCFGEMVDLLWRDNVEATLQLEALWNELLADQRVSLLCAYRMDPFDRGIQGVLHQISRCHSHVLPVENVEDLEHAVDRAWEEVFGVRGDASTLRKLVVAGRTSGQAMPRAQAALFALHELSPALADQVLERGRQHYGRRRVVR